MPSCCRETPHTVPYCAMLGSCASAAVSSHTCPSSSCSRAWGEPRRMASPWFIKISSRAMNSTSCTTWVHSSTIFSPAISPMRFRTATRWRGSRPAVGSSSTRISGSWSRLGKSSRCFMPPDQPRMGRPARLREIQPRASPVHAPFGILPAHALEGRHVIEKLLPGEAGI